MSIQQLNEWCKKHNKRIIVHSGLLCGFGFGYDNIAIYSFNRGIVNSDDNHDFKKIKQLWTSE